MVIKLELKKDKVQAPTQHKRFTLQDLEQLFTEAGKNWHEFYEKNKTKFWKENFDIYKWIVFPLITRDEDERFYRCILHPTVTVDTGDKKLQFPCKNIHFSELLFHCVFYAPEEHKQYIIEKLKLSNG